MLDATHTTFPKGVERAESRKYLFWLHTSHHNVFESCMSMCGSGGGGGVGGGGGGGVMLLGSDP